MSGRSRPAPSELVQNGLDGPSFQAVSDDKNPLEQAVDQAMDTFVFAPIGLLFDGPALFPKLVEKGRNQVQVARMIGQMAVQMGQTEAEKRVGKAQSQVRDSLIAAGIVPAKAPAPAKAASPDPDASPASQDPAPAKPAPKKPPAAAKKTAKKTASSTAKKSASAAATKLRAPKVTSLGIPDYDALSASQVVSRLRGLAPKDLDALKAYEAATRARKTVLNKITQLQKS